MGKKSLRSSARKWAEHILITEWAFLGIENDEGEYLVVLLGALETTSGTIELYIADGVFPGVSAVLPTGEVVQLGRYIPGSWPWRKLREIKYRDRLFAEIAAARMFSGDFTHPPVYGEDLPDLPFMNFDGDDEIIN